MAASALTRISPTQAGHVSRAAALTMSPQRREVAGTIVLFNVQAATRSRATPCLLGRGQDLARASN
jgi:hypothetical protein